MIAADRLRVLPLDAEGFPRAMRSMQSALSDGVAPAIVAGLWQASDPDTIRTVAAGKDVTVDTFFDLASVSKVYATSAFVAQLVDRGWLTWNTPLKSFFPELAYSGVELRHLLSHTAGLPAWAPFWEKIRDRLAPTPVHHASIQERQRLMRELVLKVTPERPVGESAVYSDVTFLLLGFVLEEITGMPFDRAVERFVWEPLGARRSSYHRVRKPPAEDRRVGFAVTEDSAWRGGILQGQVHDDNCWAMGGYGGHAGVFADVRDVLHYARRLMGGFVSRETLSAMWSRVAAPEDCERTLGWDTPAKSESSAGPLFSRRSVGHLGFTGTSLWIDPDAGLAVALLTNRVHPTRENIKIRTFRPEFHKAIREDLLSSGR